MSENDILEIIAQIEQNALYLERYKATGDLFNQMRINQKLNAIKEILNGY